MMTPPTELDLCTVASAKVEAVVDDLKEIVALVEKEEGLTTDCTDATDKDRKKKSVKSV